MKGQKGFTLIELLLVVMISGFMLAVILPRGLRATTDAKYNLVRQNAAELGSYGNDWIEQQILAQDADSVASRDRYLTTLTSRSNWAGAHVAAWIAVSGISNWNNNGGRLIVPGRNMNNNLNVVPENTIQDIIEPSKIMRNPFTGASVFSTANYDGATGRLIPGALACARASDNSTGGAFEYFAFVFTGTDSTGWAFIDPTNVDMHAGQTANSLSGLREGVFFAKVRQ